jgi:mannose-6-phosphate isomerase-like protein (cupin superfamily)
MLRLVKVALLIPAAVVFCASASAQHTTEPAAAQSHGQLPVKHISHVTEMQLGKQPEEKYGWGEIQWLMNSKIDPGAKQTLGIVRIDAGKSNALHLHPNCEELMYILSGTGTTKIDNKVVTLSPGDLVRVPPGVLHMATASASGPLVALISYSSPDRQMIVPGAAHE